MAKISGALATLEIGTADDGGVTLPAGDTFTAIGGVTSYTGPGGEKPEIDVTDLASTAKEFIAGLPDNGEVTFEGFHDEDEATQTTLWGDYNDAANSHVRNYQITFSDGTAYNFNGFIKSLTHNVANEEGIGLSGSIRVSGALTRTLS